MRVSLVSATLPPPPEDERLTPNSADYDPWVQSRDIVDDIIVGLENPFQKPLDSRERPDILK